MPYYIQEYRKKYKEIIYYKRTDFNELKAFNLQVYEKSLANTTNGTLYRTNIRRNTFSI